MAWAKAPGFNPMKLVAVVAGFAIFPPLGIAALLYFVWKSHASGSYSGEAAFAGHRGGMGCGRRHGRWSGNMAFDQHQAEVMQGLREEREAFRSHHAEERRKRDQDAFDAFRAAKATTPEAPKAD